MQLAKAAELTGDSVALVTLSQSGVTNGCFAGPAWYGMRNSEEELGRRIRTFFPRVSDVGRPPPPVVNPFVFVRRGCSRGSVDDLFAGKISERCCATNS